MGPALGGDPAAAARLRGPGPRPLLRPSRAVPAAGGREQHDDRHVLVAGQLLPPAAPPGAVAGAPAADRVHARSRCCGSRRRSASSTTSPSGTFQPVLPDPTADPARCARVLLCAGKVYYDLAAERAASRPHRRRDRAGRAALPAARRRAARRARPLPRRRAGVGAGGAGQPGRLAVHGAEPARAPRAAGRCCAPRAGPRPRRPSARTRCTRRSSSEVVATAFA